MAIIGLLGEDHIAAVNHLILTHCSKVVYIFWAWYRVSKPVVVYEIAINDIEAKHCHLPKLS